jgi:hypothetical protein
LIYTWLSISVSLSPSVEPITVKLITIGSMRRHFIMQAFMKKIISEQSVVRPSEKMKKSLETYYPT